MTRPKPTVVFDTYWYFAVERQRVFFKRLDGDAGPWTADPILANYKFTNAYRASDRTSQYLIRRVIYDSIDRNPRDVILRILLFKIFNKIETWEALEQRVGDISADSFDVVLFNRELSRLLHSGRRIYSAAYIMPPPALGFTRKHRNHLSLIERMAAESSVDQMLKTKSLADLFTYLQSFPGIGRFLAYQYAIDLNYSPLFDFSEDEFVVPGPGALDGIRKCFGPSSMSPPDLIKYAVEIQEDAFDRLELTFPSLWGRRLKLIDAQNLFCEIDKYARVAHPEMSGISGRTRIKQRLRAKSAIPEPFYPPKWQLTSAVGSLS